VFVLGAWVSSPRHCRWIFDRWALDPDRTWVYVAAGAVAVGAVVSAVYERVLARKLRERG